MGQINTGKVIVGGLLAGLIINISSFLANGVVFASQFEEMIADLGVEAPGGSEMAFYVIVGFIFGILAVWLYAAIRPRFGPGPRTAIIAGAVLWFLARAWPIVDYSLFLDTGVGLTVAGLAWTLVETLVAAVAGAWLYQEETATSA